MAKRQHIRAPHKHRPRGQDPFVAYSFRANYPRELSSTEDYLRFGTAFLQAAGAVYTVAPGPHPGTYTHCWTVPQVPLDQEEEE